MPAEPALDPTALGRRIASLRHAHAWSQRRLAEAAGVSHGYIALLELGRLPSPGKFRLDAVARALNLRTSDTLTAPSLPDDDDESAISAVGGAADPPTIARQAVPTVEPNVVVDSNVIRRVAVSTPSRDAAPGSAIANEPEAPRAHTLGPDSDKLAAATSHSDPDPRFTPTSRTISPPSDPIASNVLGRLEQLRAGGARPLPVFRWGACGDPRDQESGPDPDRLEYPPPGRETLIGPTGFGVVVKGDSMAGRGIFDGDLVWVNPDRPYAVGKVVLALVTDVGGEPAGMVVKTFARTEVGDCLLSETAAGRSPVVCREFKVIGPVVGITSWRLPN
jgi:SOS-response transcriptional repressor LexA/transcriptional regulator with XRE-family HTH domain